MHSAVAALYELESFLSKTYIKSLFSGKQTQDSSNNTTQLKREYLYE